MSSVAGPVSSNFASARTPANSASSSELAAIRGTEQ